MDRTNRSNRVECYKARDSFFECLDDAEDDNGQDGECVELQRRYHNSCMPSWVKYFDERRKMKKIPFEKQIDGKRLCYLM